MPVRIPYFFGYMQLWCSAIVYIIARHIRTLPTSFKWAVVMVITGVPDSVVVNSCYMCIVNFQRLCPFGKGSSTHNLSADFYLLLRLVLATELQLVVRWKTRSIVGGLLW